jgi:GNAT superfamily N-acetyltransferase
LALEAVITVRPFEPADLPALVLLLEKMQRHYRAPSLPRETVLQDLASLSAGVEILVAESESIIGFAAFSAIYPGPGLKGGFFLKELFVEDVARGSGVGRQLLQAVARIALERGLKRVDWTADRNNPNLLDYYDRTGAVREEDKVFFRLAGDALTKFAERQDD